jgi:hypothetical protein
MKLLMLFSLEIFADDYEFVEDVGGNMEGSGHRPSDDHSPSYANPTGTQTRTEEHPGSPAQSQPDVDTRQESRGRCVCKFSLCFFSPAKIHRRSRFNWGVRLDQRDSNYRKYFAQVPKPRWLCCFCSISHPEAGGDIKTEVYANTYVKNYPSGVQAISSRLAAAMASIGTLGISAITYAVSIHSSND